MWFPPFIWPELGVVDLGEGRRAHWLMGIPITEAERAFLHQEGFDRLEQLFTDQQVAYFNVNRASFGVIPAPSSRTSAPSGHAADR